MDFKCLWFAAERFPGDFTKHILVSSCGGLGKDNQISPVLCESQWHFRMCCQVTRACECRASGSSSPGAHQELKPLAVLKA